jgi:hypothetical protein
LRIGLRRLRRRWLRLRKLKCSAARVVLDIATA